MKSENTHGSASERSILVTDSGLGGLSVFNDIANRLKKGSPWKKVNLVYFNAWPAPHRGYNHFDKKEKRVRVFNNAMGAMEKFHPDLILIACNTLSVIYPYTEFCESSDTPVLGIVDLGIKMIHERLATDPDSVALIFGTPTTTNAKSHEKGLTQLGIEKDRIINIACTDLAGWIERQPFSHTVDQMINEFVKQAGERLGRFKGNVYAALCCTHFGYRQALFTSAFTEFISGTVTLLNPNVRMAEQVFDPAVSAPLLPGQIDMHIVSKAKWEEEQVAAYLSLLTDISPATRKALTHYKLDHRLFSVD